MSPVEQILDNFPYVRVPKIFNSLSGDIKEATSIISFST